MFTIDPRVSFKLEKVLQGSSEDSDEENDDVEQKRLIHRPKDITKPLVIDLKDFESESEEDYVSSRQHFQQQRSISTDSRKRLVPNNISQLLTSSSFNINVTFL